jgi:chemotaxis protein MotB
MIARDPLPGEENSRGVVPIWAITFADLMTLLMSFFVLLFSFSSLEAEKFKEVAGSMRAAFGVAGLAPAPRPAPGTGAAMPGPDASAEELDLVERLRRAVEQAGLGKQGTARVTGRGVALRLDGEAAFESGSADLTPEVLPLLDRIARVAEANPGEIEVEGHTDDVPIATERYPSNWELSAARAGSAVRYLAWRGLPASRIKAIGYADSRPIASNTSDESRARNRRVEFLFVNAAVPTGTAGVESATPAGPRSAAGR